MRKLNQFIHNAICELEQDGVTVILAPFAIDEFGNRGEYAGDTHLYVDTRARDWRLVFLHEYCHHRQQKLQTPINISFELEQQALRLESEEVPFNTPCRALMEQECELMALGLIDLLDLEVNIEDFVKDANEHLVNNFGEEYAI